jgi:hypothetical protein
MVIAPQHLSLSLEYHREIETVPSFSTVRCTGYRCQLSLQQYLKIVAHMGSLIRHNLIDGIAFGQDPLPVTIIDILFKELIIMTGGDQMIFAEIPISQEIYLMSCSFFTKKN